jgi:hypothetical protein
VRDRQDEPEGHAEPVAAAVLAGVEADRVRRHRIERDRGGVARRIALGEEQQVAERLSRVPLAVDLGVAKAARSAGQSQRGEPRQHRDGAAEPAEVEPDGLRVAAVLVGRTTTTVEAAGQGASQHQRRQRDEEAKRDGPAALLARWRELGVHHIAGLPDEARIAAGGQVEVGIHVERVSHVGRVEAVRPLGRPAQDQRAHPVHRRHEQRADAPDGQPDEVGDHDDHPEEHGRAPAVAVIPVRDGDAALLSGHVARR